MPNLYARARVVLTSAVTPLMVVAVVLTHIADELIGWVGADNELVVAILQIVAVILSIIAVIRRVTPVLPDARGLLPPPTGIPVTPAEAALRERLPRAHREALDAAGG